MESFKCKGIVKFRDFFYKVWSLQFGFWKFVFALLFQLYQLEPISLANFYADSLKLLFL